MESIRNFLLSLKPGEPLVHKQMAMFPLLNDKAGKKRDYLNLDEALEAGSAQVSEVSEDGSVPELSFANLGDKPVLLIEGEELIGAKQNRTLNVSILAPAGKTIPIPVSCVERGRWGYSNDRMFHRSDRSHFARGRRGTTAACAVLRTAACPTRTKCGTTLTRKWRVWVLCPQPTR